MVGHRIQAIPAQQQALSFPDVQHQPFYFFRAVFRIAVLFIAPECDNAAGLRVKCLRPLVRMGAGKHQDHTDQNYRLIRDAPVDPGCQKYRQHYG